MTHNYQYSQTVMDHWLHPRHPGVIENPDGRARKKGACGDLMEIFLRVSKDQRVIDASFMTDGCTTSIASGSMAVELAIGKSIQQARRITDGLILDRLGGLPEESRHCASLAADTLHAAIDNYLIIKDIPWKGLYRSLKGNG